MSVLKSFLRPQNHQDFEVFCSFLLNEYWKPVSIKRNGRNGQRQNGVDIVAKMPGDTGWYGVQCKAGELRSLKNFTKKEIDQEIANAIFFEPSLSRLYFFTTASKDASIEEYIRKKSLEHIKRGLFEIDIFSWGDIEDLLRINPQTLSWYLGEINSAGNKSVALTFADGKTTTTCKPLFEQKTLHYKQAIIPANYYSPFIYFSPVDGTNRVPKYVNYKKNLALCGLKIRIHNTGDIALEQVTIRLQFEGNVVSVQSYNTSGSQVTIVNPKELHFSFQENHILKIDLPDTLVPDNDYLSSEFFLGPHHTEKKVIINWAVLSKNFKQEGTLTVLLEPQIEYTSEDILVDDPLQVKVIKMNIEDFYEGWG